MHALARVGRCGAAARVSIALYKAQLGEVRAVESVLRTFKDERCANFAQNTGLAVTMAALPNKVAANQPVTDGKTLRKKCDLRPRGKVHASQVPCASGCNKRKSKTSNLSR